MNTDAITIWARALVALALLCSHPSLSASAAQAQQIGGGDPDRASQFDRFAPREATFNGTLDYTWWDTQMRNLVLSMGPSTRSRLSRPQRTVGSQILWGHTTSYRLEGSRLTFSLLEPDVIASFTAYRRDLEQTAERIDLTALPRDEQLAF